MIRRSLFAGVVAMVAIVPTSAFAADDFNPKGTFKGSEVSFVLGPAFFNATLTINGPDGFNVSNFSKEGSPAIDLIRERAKADGDYVYQITAASIETVPIDYPLNNGRGDADRGKRQRAVAATGGFVVRGGLIVDTPDVPESK